MDALIHEKKINEIQIQLFMYLSLATSASLPRQKRAEACRDILARAFWHVRHDLFPGPAKHGSVW